VHLALRRALDRLVPHVPAAPWLLWSETTSALRQLASRGDIEDGQAEEALGSLERVPLTLASTQELATDAYALAARLGWARTYDAEYVVLAQRLGCPLLTVDARLARTVGKLVDLAPLESI
jgi:predicted nucleic acid-binding protein